MLHHINSTEYLNYEDTKFSKSRSVGVFGDDVKQTGIGVDLWRFYLLSNRPERNDTAFTWQDFFEKTNAEFIDNIGNLVNRTLVYLQKNFDSTISDCPLDEEQQAFADSCRKDCSEITQALEEVRLRDAIRRLLALGSRGNKFFQDMQPWERIKTDRTHACATVSLLAYLVQSLAVALEPFMPETAQRMLAMLAITDYDWSRVGSFAGLDGHRIAASKILYKKLNMADAEKFRKKFSGDQPDFSCFEIKAARIAQVERHPEADHLYCLQLECGEAHMRTVAAGLVKHYSPEELTGRSVLMLANLKAVQVRGVLSQGMVLVCEKRNKLELLDAGGAAPGMLVDVESPSAPQESEITIDQFKAAPLRIVDSRMMFDDVPCCIDGRPILTHVLKNGPVR
jgi:methionyl-tRNA synthetase